MAVKVSASRRINLPAEVRKQALERVRALARPFAPKGRLASEELTAERRAEAQREEKDDVELIR